MSKRRECNSCGRSMKKTNIVGLDAWVYQCDCYELEKLVGTLRKINRRHDGV